ncbi:MAG: hypothetical protein ACRDJY_08055 [Thermoleophilaceae bacterium]
MESPKNEARKDFEPMEVAEVGHVGEVLQGGGGKLSPVDADQGDNRKPKGQA